MSPLGRWRGLQGRSGPILLSSVLLAILLPRSAFSQQSTVTAPVLQPASPAATSDSDAKVRYEGGKLSVKAEKEDLAKLLKLISDSTGCQHRCRRGRAGEREPLLFGPIS